MDNRLHILQHSLGVDPYGQGPMYREHFCAGPGHSDYETCMELVDAGHMVRRPSTAITGGDDLFLVTEAGRVWMVANSPRRPKISRAKARYLKYLSCDWFDSFGDFLRSEVSRG